MRTHLFKTYLRLSCSPCGWFQSIKSWFTSWRFYITPDITVQRIMFHSVAKRGSFWKYVSPVRVVVQPPNTWHFKVSPETVEGVWDQNEADLFQPESRLLSDPPARVILVSCFGCYAFKYKTRRNQCNTFNQIQRAEDDVFREEK